MDPNAAYRRWWQAVLAEDKDEANAAYCALRAWLERGGFEPLAFEEPQARKQFFAQYDMRTGALSC